MFSASRLTSVAGIEASSMSLAMWEMYGGGSESVAVRSTPSKLKGLIEDNATFAEKQGLAGDVA